MEYLKQFSVFSLKLPLSFISLCLPLFHSWLKVWGSKQMCLTNSLWDIPRSGTLRLFSMTADSFPLTPKDPYSGRTTPLTSKRCILYIYSTNTGTEHFKHGIYSPFFSLQNAVCFIILMYFFPVLFTFYIQGVLKF